MERRLRRLNIKIFDNLKQIIKVSKIKSFSNQPIDIRKFYLDYSQKIEKIIDQVGSQGISKEELDHIVWYCLKGK